MPDTDFFAYFAVYEPEEEASVPAFAVGDKPYIDNVVSSWKNKEQPPEDDKGEKPKEPDFTHESALTESLSSAVDYGLSQIQLVLAATATPSLFRSVIARQSVLAPTVSDAKLVKHVDQCVVYGLTQDQYFAFKERKATLDQMRQGVAAMPGATLMSLVATFDTLVVDILGKMLRLDNSWLGKSEKSIPFSRLKTIESLEELFNETVADEIFQFSRGSHDEQARYIETQFGIGIKKSWKRWPDYIEIFERRNLVAHGERMFNKRYVEICKNAGHKGSEKLIGQEVRLTPVYLSQAVDVLLEFAVLLTFSLWRKLVNDKEAQAFENLNEAAFKLISNRRYVAAERILDFALSLDKVKIAADTKQRLIVNQASAARHAGDIEKAERILDIDWTGSPDLVKMCVHAVKAESDEVAKLLAPLKGAGALSAHSFKQWPCFSFVRDDEGVRTKFAEVFGEPLKAASDEATPRDSSDKDGAVGIDAVSQADGNASEETESTVH